MTIPITATMLYDLLQCPHRPTMDLFGDPSRRDKVSEFVQLLWDKGLAHEQEVMASLDVPFLDLSPYSLDETDARQRLPSEKGNNRNESFDTVESNVRSM